MNPETTHFGQEMQSFVSSGQLSPNSVVEGMISSGGSRYCKQEKYKSGWNILPDLVANLLSGFKGEQEFKMRKYGMHQGHIRVSLCTEGRYGPRVGTSGSLEVAYMVEPVNHFLRQEGLEEFFDLKNALLINTIHTFFCSLMLGREKDVCEWKDGLTVAYLRSRSSFSISETGILNAESEKIFDCVRKFFQEISIPMIFGKLSGK